jgi:hypothetical protein
MDLTPDEYRHCARVLFAFFKGRPNGCHDGFDDMLNGEPPQPAILRVLRECDSVTDAPATGRRQRYMRVKKVMGPNAQSRTICAHLDCSQEGREQWATRLRSCLVGLVEWIDVVTINAEEV